jgi:hypothetical protein
MIPFSPHFQITLPVKSLKKPDGLSRSTVKDFQLFLGLILLARPLDQPINSPIMHD